MTAGFFCCAPVARPCRDKGGQSWQEYRRRLSYDARRILAKAAARGRRRIHLQRT